MNPDRGLKCDSMSEKEKLTGRPSAESAFTAPVESPLAKAARIAESERLEQFEAGRQRRQRSQELLQWLIAKAPLYQVLKVPAVWRRDDTTRSILPSIVSMPCSNCGLEATNWAAREGGYTKGKGLDHIAYACRNCEANEVTIFFAWKSEGDDAHFEKVGRYPKPEINPTKDLAQALGKHLDLYRKGMTLRHHSFGLGALVYFRRIVEETTAELLNLLEEAIKEIDPNSEQLALVEKAKKAARFEDKVKIAADAIPAHLRIGEANPLHVLFKLLSDGLHVRSDEESVEIVDGIDNVLKHLFSELRAHTRERKVYAAALKESQERLEKLKREPS